MGFGETKCDLGIIRVVDLRPHDTYGIVAYLDLQFPDVKHIGHKHEKELEPVAERTEGIEGIYTSVNKDVADGQLKPGQANAKILFDGSVKSITRAAKCLSLALSAIGEHLTDLDPATFNLLTHDFHQDVNDILRQELEQGLRGFSANNSN